MFSKQQERTNKLRKLVDSWRFQRIILINLRQGEGGSACAAPPQSKRPRRRAVRRHPLQKLIQLVHHVAACAYQLPLCNLTIRLALAH